MSVIKVDGVKFPNNQKLIKVFCWEKLSETLDFGFKKIHRNDCSYPVQDAPKHIYTYIHIYF